MDDTRRCVKHRQRPNEPAADYHWRMEFDSIGPENCAMCRFYARYRKRDLATLLAIVYFLYLISDNVRIIWLTE